jgi:peptide/nickel transport system ATP-binding protein
MPGRGERSESLPSRAEEIGASDAPVLRVRDLSLSFRVRDRAIPVLASVDLTVARGEIVALVGESGSGKSSLGLAIQGLLDRDSAPSVSGSIEVCGEQMVGARSRAQRRVRRDHLAAIFQDPMLSLNPTMRIGPQLQDAVRRSASPEAWLGRVGLPNPGARLRQFPHELSGGQRQRVMIAMAMASQPDIVIADEPTTALDVTVQGQILDLIRDLRSEAGTAFVFITHDLAVATVVADRIVVLYAGHVVETGPVRNVAASPAHPYTAALLEARFPLTADKLHQLPTLTGEPPAPGAWPLGCCFEPRCQLATAECRERAPTLSAVSQHAGRAACIHTDKVTPGVSRVRAPAWPIAAATRSDEPAYLLEIDDVTKTYRTRKRQADRTIFALRGVSVKLKTAEALAIVGESGSGKSTLLRVVAGLVRADSGRVALSSRERPQLIYQEAGASLTPWLSVQELIEERLRRDPLSRAERRHKVAESLDLVGLPAHFARAKPLQLSGGQRQRVAIARAVVVPPSLLLCDEPVSAMDVSLAAGILNLLGTLRRRLAMALLFVTHDLAAARYVADRIVVMKDGQIVESGDSDAIAFRPQETYTRALLAAMPDSQLARVS